MEAVHVIRGRGSACSDFRAPRCPLTHPITHARKRAIAARIRGATPSVVSTINFNDEPRGLRDEVNDEPADGRLMPKRKAKPISANFPPKSGLRWSHRD